MSDYSRMTSDDIKEENKETDALIIGKQSNTYDAMTSTREQSSWLHQTIRGVMIECNSANIDNLFWKQLKNPCTVYCRCPPNCDDTPCLYVEIVIKHKDNKQTIQVTGVEKNTLNPNWGSNRFFDNCQVLNTLYLRVMNRTAGAFDDEEMCYFGPLLLTGKDLSSHFKLKITNPRYSKYYRNSLKFSVKYSWEETKATFVPLTDLSSSSYKKQKSLELKVRTTDHDVTLAKTNNDKNVEDETKKMDNTSDLERLQQKQATPEFTSYNSARKIYKLDVVLLEIEVPFEWFKSTNDLKLYKNVDLEVFVDGNIELKTSTRFVVQKAELKIGACHRMVRRVPMEQLPTSITFKLSYDGKKMQETIDYKNIMWTKNSDDSKFVKTNKYALYQEHHVVTNERGIWLPNENQCKIFADGSVDDYKGETISIHNIPDDNEIYYSKIDNRVFALKAEDISNSKVFNRKTETSTDQNPDVTVVGAFISNDYHQEFYENITEAIWISMRYNWLISACLYGQDNEFNIFRSLCFIEPGHNDDKIVRLSIGMLCLILQIFLTFGIASQVFNNWDTETMFDNNKYDDWTITIISILVFSFISLMYTFTVRKYYEFYENMHMLFEISWIIIILDFISNILIGLIISICAFFYLLQSETVTDVVLNSFALTFVIE
eukprot:34994_1